MSLKFYAAPLQGLSEAIWRRLHRNSPWAADEYFTPFLRLEGGEPRRKDLRDLGAEPQAIPQIIFRNFEEFRTLVEFLAAKGYRRIDLNLGCPFPPQVKKGRGAGLLLNTMVLSEIRDYMDQHPELTFSVKMRPGVESPDDWRRIAAILNSLPLSHIAVHPRLIRNPYDGPLLMDQFSAMATEFCHPTVYNGSLTSPADIDRVLSACPGVNGLMIGRGLFARPTLIAEWRSGTEMTPAERGRAIRRINSEILNEMCNTLCGDTQILNKIKPYWELAPEELLGRKTLRAIKKATTLEKLATALK